MRAADVCLDGNGNVWHFDSLQAESTEPWKESLHSGGAESLRHVKEFLEPIEWWQCIPDRSLFAQGQGSDETPNVALRHAESGDVAVYLADPQPVKLRLEQTLPDGQLYARWINPATGEEIATGALNDRSRVLKPPSEWDDAFLHVTCAPGG